MYRKLAISIARIGRGLPFAAVGTSAYILGYAIHPNSDVLFIVLILFAGLSLIFEFHWTPSSRPTGLMFVVLFVVSLGVSTFVSIEA